MTNKTTMQLQTNTALLKTRHSPTGTIKKYLTKIIGQNQTKQVTTDDKQNNHATADN